MIEFKLDNRQWIDLENKVRRVSRGAFLKAMGRAVNKAGDKARTDMRRALVNQTGLKYGTFVRALRSTRGGPSSGRYEIKSKGGNVRLRFFRPRETRGGVVAYPWNKQKLYPRAFTKGGRRPRKALNRGVLQRTGAGRLPVQQARSGLFIPTEMVTGGSEAAFYRASEQIMVAELSRQLSLLLK